MPYLIVLAMATAAGVAVYALTLRSATHPTSLSTSVSDPGGTVETPQAGRATYLTGDGRPDWQMRLTGLLGLVVAVVVGGIALAAVLYLSVSTGVRFLTG
jgi:hypothetical protein